MFKPTKEQIAEWKKKYSRIFKVTAKEYNKCAILRSPSRETMGYVSKMKDPIAFNAELIKQCWLAGDEEIQTDDQIFMGIADQLPKLLKFAEVELEEL